MNYGKLYITEKGQALAAKTLLSKAMQFTKFAVGSGELENVSEIASLENLVTPVKDFDITKISKETETQIKVKGLFKNTDVEEGFNLREIGLFAKDLESEEEILFAYVNYGNNAEFVENTEDAKKEFYYDFNIAVGNAENVEITINPEAIYVTEKEFQELLPKEQTYTEIITEEKEIITLPFWYKIGADMLRVRYTGQLITKASSFAGNDGYYLEITEKDVIGEEGQWSNKIQSSVKWTWLKDAICFVEGKGVLENEPSAE